MRWNGIGNEMERIASSLFILHAASKSILKKELAFGSAVQRVMSLCVYCRRVGIMDAWMDCATSHQRRRMYSPSNNREKAWFDQVMHAFYDT